MEKNKFGKKKGHFFCQSLQTLECLAVEIRRAAAFYV